MKYTDQKKAAIIVRHQGGDLIQHLCDKYHVACSALFRWRKVYCAASPSQSRTFSIREFDALQFKVEKLSNIITILWSFILGLRQKSQTNRRFGAASI